MPQWVLIKNTGSTRRVCSGFVYEMVERDLTSFTVVCESRKVQLPSSSLVATYNTQQEAERILERLQKEWKKIDKKLKKSYDKQQSILKGAIV